MKEISLSSAWDVHEGLFLFFSYFSPQHLIAQSKSLSANWDLVRSSKSLSALAFTSTVPGNSLVKFHGQISQISLLWHFYSNKVEDLKNLQRGLANPLLVLDFREPRFAQVFRNLLDNQYVGAINGKSAFQDPFDLVYDEQKGWTAKHWVQKVSLPKFDENIVERVNFGIHIDLKFININQIIRGITKQGLFHRYKYDAGGAVVNKIQVGFLKDNFDTSLEIYVTIGDTEIKHTPFIYCIGVTAFYFPFCTVRYVTVTVNKHQDDEFYTVGFSYDQAIGETTRHVVSPIVFEDDDLINLGRLYKVVSNTATNSRQLFQTIFLALVTIRSRSRSSFLNAFSTFRELY